MDILVTTGTGEGPTAQAAFDAALLDAGVADYNLIRLVSVIPPGGVVQRVRYVTPRDEFGHRLYVAMARQDAAHAGQLAVAGLGWTQDKQSGRGLLAEASGRVRPAVETELRATLDAMVAARSLSFGAIEMEIVGVECRDRPACALAVAVYRADPWHGPA